jgi:hypothetical protein
MAPPLVQALARNRRSLAAAAAAQACAFLNAVTAVSSESISLQGVDVSTFQARPSPLTGRNESPHTLLGVRAAHAAARRAS